MNWLVIIPIVDDSPLPYFPHIVWRPGWWSPYASMLVARTTNSTWADDWAAAPSVRSS